MKQSHRLPKARAAREHEPLTIERLERAVALCAYLVVLDGPVVIPLFERMEADLAAARAEQDTVARAKRLLENLGSPMQRNLLLTSSKHSEGTAIS
jgi:hypothetical protein